MNKIRSLFNDRKLNRASFAISLFITIPWLFILGFTYLPIPDAGDEFMEKMSLFEHRPQFNTVVVGDSRVLRLSESQFSNRDWIFFNMGFSGLSPEDVEASLNFSLASRPISRVIIGVSFENMTQRYPFEFSRYSGRYKNPQKLPTDSTPIAPSFEVGQVWSESKNNYLSLKKYTASKFSVFNDLIKKNDYQLMLDKILNKIKKISNEPSLRASTRFYSLLDILQIKKIQPQFLSDGSVGYFKIQRDINDGKYNFELNRNPWVYWSREDGEIRYLQDGMLSKNAQETYRRIFLTLREKRIPVIVFETGKISEYQKSIDSNPILSKLQDDWRNFYRNEESVCLQFLDRSNLDGVYRDEDFFDATHFIGLTSQRLADKILGSMVLIENKCNLSKAR